MKVRILYSVLIVLFINIASVYSNGSNVMILHNVTAQAGETIVVELEIANDDEFVGFNLDIPFPEGFTYVPGSAQLFRKTNHQLSFTVPHSNTARIIAFSFTNAAFLGNEGAVLTFELETPSDPGNYILPIVAPIIGNIEAQNILTGTVDATITLEGDVPDPEYSLDLYANPASAGTVSGDGNYYEGEQVTATAIPNAGYEFVHWTDISDNVVSTQASYGFSMPGDDLSLWANFEEDDDPEPAGENLMMLHDVTANAGDIITIEMEILNEDEFVGFSLDIPLPADFDYVEGSAQLFRSTNHGFVFNVIESNVAKIIAFSITNDAFLGNEGVIFSFDVVTPEAPGTYPLPLVEAIIGNAEAEDILTGTVDGTVTLTEAVDPDPEYTLTLHTSPPAGGTVSGDGNYEAGTMVTASATANTGYEFINWTDVSGNVVSTQASYNFSMPDADLDLWANFEEDDDPEPGDQNMMIIHDVTAPAGEIITVEVEIVNDNEFVGFNLDIPFPDGFTYVPGSAQLFRHANHQLSFTVPHSNTARIIAFSFTNAEFSGNEGTVLTFQLETPDIPGDYLLPIVDPIIGNIDAEDILTGTVDGTVTLEEFVPDPEYMLTLLAAPPEGGTLSGEGEYTEGTAVLIEAAFNAGYYFIDWTDEDGNTVSDEAVTVIEMPASDVTLFANFAMTDYTLTLTAQPGVGGTATGAGIYNFGDQVEVDAIPNEGWHFVNWTDEDGNTVSDEAATVIEMPAGDVTLFANFAMTDYTLTLTAQPGVGGTTTGGGIYNFGDQVEVDAIPNEGWHFVNWTDDEGNTISDEPFNVIEMPAADLEIIAHLELVDYLVSVQVQPDVAGTVSGAGYHNFGETVTLQAHPGPEYEFVNWTSPDGTVLSDVMIYSFNMPAVDVSVVANFEQITYTLNVNVIGQGIVDTEPNEDAYLPGTEVELTAVPDTGWIFNNWMGDYNGFNNPVTIVMNADKTVIARFIQLFVTNVVVSGPGSIAIPETEVVTEQYTASVFNQFNQLMPEEEVIWSTIPDQDELPGVSIDDDGVLSITADAEEDEILIVATSQSNPNVFGVRMVELEGVITKFTLTLNIFGNGTVLVNEIPYGSSTQNIELDANAFADLLASPAFGWSFINWTGDVTDPNFPETSVLMDGNKIISVHFSQDQYFLTVDVDGNGTVSKTPDLAFYGYNQPVIVRASAAPGWSFSHWTGDVVNPNNASTYIMMNEDKELTAHFVQLPVTLTINKEGNGSVIADPPGPTYDPGTQVVLSAEAALGWEFSHWVGDVAEEEAELTTILMDANKIITAHFIEAEYELNVNVDGNGSVGINPNQESYVFGQPVIIRANPATGWEFSHWTGNVLDNESSRTAVLMLEDQDVTAHFVQLGYTLTLGIEGNGTVNVDPEQELYEPGTQVTLLAEHAGTGFIYWTGAYNGFNNPVTITMGADRNMTAHFVEWDFKELYQNTMIPAVVPDVPGAIYIGGPGQVLIPGAENEPNQVQYTAFVADDDDNILPDEEVTWSLSGPEGVPLTGLSIDPDSGILSVASNAFLPVIGVVATSVSNTELSETRIVSLVNEITMYSLGLFVNGHGSVSINENDYTAPFQTIELNANQLYDIVAEPGDNWFFLSWSVDLEGENPVAELLMDDHKTVVADFSEDQYFLTVNATGEGAVNVNPDQESYPYGELVNISALAGPGWVFSHWTGDVLNPDAASTIVIMDADKTIDAVFTQSEYALTVSTSGEGAVLISPDQETYVYGDEVALTATPIDGWQFDGWTGDVISQENPIIITITGNKSIHAHFSEILLVPAELTISGAEEILIPLSGQPASEIQYSAVILDQFGEPMETEDVIWTLTGNIPTGVSISADGLLSVSSQATPLTIGVMATSLSEPELSEVLFVELIRETLTITAQPNNPDYGIVEGGGDYIAGSQVVLTAQAHNGYHFVSWTENGEIVFDEAVYTFIVQENRDLIANFAINSYIITATAGDNGMIDPAGDVSVNHGADQVFTITPDEGYHIAEVLVNGVDLGAVAEYTFEDVTGDQGIHAVFAINTYIITATAGENGSIDPSGDIVVEHGADQSFTITPDEGYHIAEVLVNGVDVGAVAEYTFEGVTGVQDIHAVFAINTYIITATAGENGSIDPSGNIVVEHGSDQSFTINPNEGYHISSVLVNGVDVGAITEYTFENITEGQSIHATFAINTYIITATAGENGSIDPAGDIVVEHGSDQTFTMHANDGYHIADVSVDGASVGPLTEYTFDGVTEAHSIHVDFMLTTYSLTFEIFDAETEESISDAVITLDGDEYDAGIYVFENLEPRNYAYVIGHDDYVIYEGEVEIVNMDVIENVELEPLDDDTSVEVTEIIELTVFPNPASNMISVESHVILHEVRLTDLTGKIVYASHVMDNQVMINVSRYDTGIYILQVSSIKGTFARQVIISR